MGTVLSAVTGENNPAEVNEMAKQAIEVSNGGGSLMVGYCSVKLCNFDLPN